MRATLICASIGVVAILCGCAGPERKFGRGMYNVVEPIRGGEMRRSMEQTSLWEGPGSAYTTCFIRGLHRTVTPAAIGPYEIVSAPFPTYGPLLTSPQTSFPA